MRTPIAWLNLVHEKTRLLVAIAGVAFAVVLIFMNLGFLGALARTAALVYDSINADIFLVSPRTLEITTTVPFPRERLAQAQGVAGVVRGMPLYLGYVQWRNPETRINRPAFVYAYNPNDPVFLQAELNQPELIAAMKQPNTVLFDRLARPEFGEIEVGTVTEVSRRQMSVVGMYNLGGGFAADGTALMSDGNFRRVFDPRPLTQIDVGLLQLAPGYDPVLVAQQLQQLLPPDVLVLTKAEITARDRDFWLNTTSTGFIFGLGVTVSFVVGTVIVYQILYTEINSHLKEYATLKAIGYRSPFLFGVVIQEAVLLAVMGYIPGFALAVGLYELTLNATSGTLPVAMELPRAVFVFILAVSMCTLSGLLSVQRVIAADPAEVF